eukprot:TRINITY_DN18506_c0_g1_i1.p1 TRINITY_DN18506_c0_g1~~TRINITY_DN18506_c0_g1_i1.p1  ORF type:complete len:381 (+),score=93.57 TRINITY_DN18506_c0_g1_i1:56-1144(+)
MAACSTTKCVHSWHRVDQQQQKGSDTHFDVCALGSACMDQIFQIDDIMSLNMTDRNGLEKKYLAIEVSTKLNVKNVRFYPGGSAANIAVDLSFLSVKTAFLGGVGTDPNGDACLKEFVKQGVDLSSAAVFEDTATGLSVILVTPWGRDRSILAYKGSSDFYCPEHVNEEIVKHCRCFVWTSLTSDSGIAAIERCVDLAAASGALVVGAPSISIIQRRKDDAIRLVKKARVVSMNEEELEALTGEKDTKRGIKVVLGWGVEIVQITLGKEGAWLYHAVAKKVVRTSPPTVTVVDTTGAGDASLSGLIYGVLTSREPEVCGRLAAAMAGMEIGVSGARYGLPKSAAELDQWMAEHPVQQEISDL